MRSSTRKSVEIPVSGSFNGAELTRTAEAPVLPPELPTGQAMPPASAGNSMPPPPPESPNELKYPSGFDIAAEVAREQSSGIQGTRPGNSKARDTLKGKMAIKSVHFKSNPTEESVPGPEVQHILDSLEPGDSDEEEEEIEEYLGRAYLEYEEDASFTQPDASLDEPSVIEVIKARSQLPSGKRKVKKEPASVLLKPVAALKAKGVSMSNASLAGNPSNQS